ncbi:MAG: hypothetical protein M4579_003530 [Chaenotheca gracillima]|nr:MAG: hypothetical protein M4579_003530 [Chaenotheca gracillima]
MGSDDIAGPSGSNVSSSDSAPVQGNIGKPLEHVRTKERQIWKFRLRADDDEDEQDWWFASTAIPLLAATSGPLANMLSIAALVTSWRQKRNGEFPDVMAVGFKDPHWCIILNAVSLICGFVGNFFLLFNFTRRVRYIIALPMSILLWYLATGILITITAAMNAYVPPIRPDETYSQGFWYAIIAAVVYLISSMMLMVNMLGYFLGHYTQHFQLTDHQRTLILQTMMFFFWLTGGAAVFSKVCGWSYADSLYFCDVTILTVGFGDFAAPDDSGKGLVFPFSVGGIIMLGLTVGSINRFSSELSQDKVIRKHVEKIRVRTVGRSITPSMDLPVRHSVVGGDIHRVSGPLQPREEQIVQFRDHPLSEHQIRRKHEKREKRHRVVRRMTSQMRSKRSKIILLREEKDRFDAMRKIQQDTAKFKRWYNLSISLLAFGLLWCVGAAVFWRAEQREQGLNYFEALYFCYVSLLTIGYGDLSPRSNAGKPFFVIWSLIAVPTMTILISDMGETVIASFKRGTFKLADWTVLPKKGLWKSLLDRNPWLLLRLTKREEEKAAEKRVEEGFKVNEEIDQPLTLEDLAEGELDEHDLARKLALAIRHTADDLNADPPKRYSYEEWAVYTRLIRFSSQSPEEIGYEEDVSGLINWDWIGENSPLLADKTEAEWVMDRLCESLDRFMWKHTEGKSTRRHSSKPRGSSSDSSQNG